MLQSRSLYDRPSFSNSLSRFTLMVGMLAGALVRRVLLLAQLGSWYATESEGNQGRTC